MAHSATQQSHDYKIILDFNKDKINQLSFMASWQLPEQRVGVWFCRELPQPGNVCKMSRYQCYITRKKSQWLIIAKGDVSVPSFCATEKPYRS